MKSFFNKTLLVSCLLACSFIRLEAQVNFYNMNKWQDSLLRLGKEMYNLQGEAERMDKNFTFVKTLVSSLKEKHSYLYNFEKLDMISVLRSPDDKFRVFSWHIPLNDGSYLYYGAIQSKTKDGKLQLSGLLDKTFEIENPEIAVVGTDYWYGAQYYDMVPLGQDYVLLGWKGHGSTYSKKVIEILHVENGVFKLGKPVFSDESKITRKIFNFTREASMYLKYHPENKQIIFDHIVPADPSLKGNFRYYGPDLTFDAYEIQNGKLQYQSDILFQNPTREADDLNLVPGKALPNKKSGL